MDSGGSYLLLPPDKLVEKPESDTVSVVSDSCFSKLESQIISNIFECYYQISAFVFALLYLIKHESENTWGYMVKPYGQLVQVSFTHYCASTPCLSTS